MSHFKINGYYLVSPNPLDITATTGYDFFDCRTDYLKVDMDSKMAFGKYSMVRNEIHLDAFEKN